MTLERIKKQNGPDWRKSKFVYVISFLETDLHDINGVIKDLLLSSNEIGLIIADLRCAERLYSTDKYVRLDFQSNYVHLTGNSDEEQDVELRFVRQHSEKWFEVRNSVKVTGSTINNAIGLGSLKQQQQHFDKVIYKKKCAENVSQEVSERMKFGSENEIHAVATLVSKVLPVFAPDCVYFEEGCYKRNVHTEDTSHLFVVVSPDGSVRRDLNSPATFGIECKCPFPGKTYTTPIYYTIPRYYIPQVLSEMFVLDTDKLFFICYSAESSSVFEVLFSETLWGHITKGLVEVYGEDKPKRPVKKSENSKNIATLIDKFLKENVKFVAELPSVIGIRCQISSDGIVCNHRVTESNAQSMTLKEAAENVRRAFVRIENAYQLNRTRASEFLGFMISDLDREYSSELCHAVPVAYGLKGYSLSTRSVREMIEHVLKICWDKGLYTPVCCFDGQWIRIATRDRYEKPMTQLQLQKDVYTDVKKMSKAQIISEICEMNIVKCKSERDLSDVVTLERQGTAVSISNGNKYHRITITKNLLPLMQNKTNQDEHSDHGKDNSERENEALDVIVGSLPANYQNEISDELLEELVDLDSQNEDSTPETNQEYLTAPPDLFEEDAEVLEEVGMHETERADSHENTNVFSGLVEQTEQFLKTLNTNSNVTAMFEQLRYTNNKTSYTYEKFHEILKDGKTIDKHFTKNQVMTMMSPLIGILKANKIKCNSSLPKYELINTLSAIFGNGDKLGPRKRSKRTPLSLSRLCRKNIQKIPKQVLNCVYAQYLYPLKLRNWQSGSPFGDKITVENISNIQPLGWFSKPEYNDILGSYLFFILDAYHQLCGLRRVFCGPGMNQAGIKSKYVHYVAEQSETNGCGLSIALVRDMIDKQSVAYAVQTFSEKVEHALTDIGATNEATFCKLVREWYNSEDEPGISSLERAEFKMKFREWLLQDVRFDVFPPYGSFVKDIPVTLFEGLLLGMERKLQLYAFTRSGSYNVRAVGSLDIENFFGSFQDIDPHGSGVLRPDDIPAAISVALELLETKLNPDRGFYMKTSKKKVYPVNEHNISSLDGSFSKNAIMDLSAIRLRDHSFDKPDRKRGKQARKSGKVSKNFQPSRNPFPVREFHKASEAKILPHVRRGLVLDSFDACQTND